MGQLQQKLHTLGFHHVYGQSELIGGAGWIKLQCGVPMTWDKNNGVTVVYDDKGEPWVCRGTMNADEVVQNDLRRGAHVPFSNDGGYMIRQMFPRPEDRRMM